MHEDGSDGRCAVLPGCSCRKAHSSKRGAFIAVNQEPLAYISIESRGLDQGSKGGSVPRGVEKDPVLFNETARIHEFVAGPYLTGEMVRRHWRALQMPWSFVALGLAISRSMTPLATLRRTRF